MMFNLSCDVFFFVYMHVLFASLHVRLIHALWKIQLVNQLLDNQQKAMLDYQMEKEQ